MKHNHVNKIYITLLLMIILIINSYYMNNSKNNVDSIVDCTFNIDAINLKVCNMPSNKSTVDIINDYIYLTEIRQLDTVKEIYDYYQNTNEDNDSISILMFSFVGSYIQWQSIATYYIRINNNNCYYKYIYKENEVNNYDITNISDRTNTVVCHNIYNELSKILDYSNNAKIQITCNYCMENAIGFIYDTIIIIKSGSHSFVIVTDSLPSNKRNSININKKDLESLFQSNNKDITQIVITKRSD